MKEIAIANVRNFILMGHTASGKTTLMDMMLFKLGLNTRVGSIADGSSMADYTDEEKTRKISIWAKPFDATRTSGNGESYRFVMLDTPGYVDFFGQVLSASSVADAALICVDAQSGIQVGTHKAWRRCEQLKLPRAIVITGLDRDNARFETALEKIQAAWGVKCLPVVLPAADGKSMIDVLNSEDTQVNEQRGKLIEAAAESDDKLIEKYLGGETLSSNEIAKGLRVEVNTGALVPVFATALSGQMGVEELMEGIARLFPSPADRAPVDAKGNAVQVAPDAPLSALVWKIVNDPHIGHLAFLRVYGGTLHANNEFFNVTKNVKERCGAVLALNGSKQRELPAAHAGDIVALAKLKNTVLNDSICAVGQTIAFPSIEFPAPVMAYAVTAKNQGEEDKLAVALHRVAEDDPCIHFGRSADTHEEIISGMGDVHLEVTVARMKARNKIEVNLTTPKVAYKETITGKGEGHYKHKKQSGGRGQYGEVYMRVEPKREDDPEWFEDAIVGTSIPRNFLPAIQKGFMETIGRGVLAGFPLVNVKTSVYDGSYHDVDSSEIAFKIAGARALADGITKAKPVLLEPIMKVRVMVPDQFMGDINGDLTHKRGRVLGLTTEDGMQVVEAEVPQSEMFRYSSELRSITGGRGQFEMTFSRYDVVPANVAQKIIAEAQKHRQELHDE